MRPDRPGSDTPEMLIARFGLEPGDRLDDVACHRPLLRALLLVALLGRRELPLELADSIETVGELAEWAALAHSRADPIEPAPVPPNSGWPCETPRATLRPISPADLSAIHVAFNDPATSWRLPSRGQSVLPSQVEQALAGADLQLVGVARDRPTQPLALMALNRYDPTNQTADLSVIGLSRTAGERSGQRPHRGIRLEIVAMFISQAFRVLNLHKLTASVPDYNWAYFADGAGTVFEPEGTLREHLLVNGRRHDVHLLGLRWAHWREVEQDLERAFNRFIAQ